MVWPSGQVEINDTSRPDRYDRLRSGARKSAYPKSFTSFESIANDNIPTTRIC